MKKYFVIVSLILLAVFGLESITADELYQKINAYHKNITSYQAKVSQSNYFSDLDKSIVYSGNFYFTPGRMLIVFDTPSLQRLSIEKGIFTLYDQSSNTIFSSAIQSQYQRMNPLELLQLYWQRSSVKVENSQNELVNVTLKPQKDSMLSSISAQINSKSGQIHALSYKDNGGNTVKYAFSKIKINQSIPASVWNFSYPKDAQRIEE